MKTENDIIQEMKYLTDKAEELGKKKPKLTFYTDALVIVRNSTRDFLLREKNTLLNKMQIIESKWDEYYYLRRMGRSSDLVKKLIRAKFRKEYDLPKLNKQLKMLNYCLNK